MREGYQAELEVLGWGTSLSYNNEKYLLFFPAYQEVIGRLKFFKSFRWDAFSSHF